MQPDEYSLYKPYIEERAKELGKYIIATKCTIRECAKKFGVSKTTVYQDVTCRLEQLNKKLYEEVKQVLELNRAEAHLRGGLGTQDRWHQLKIMKEITR